MNHTAQASSATDLIIDIARAAAQAPAILASIPKVYSFYLAYRAQKGMQGHDPENIIASVGQIETIGDCKHAVQVTDHNGTKYRITVEVL